MNDFDWPDYLVSLVILMAMYVYGWFNGKRQYSSLYEYGEVETMPGCVRRNRKTGEVQFILWHQGEQDHKHAVWHRCDPSWWPQFVPYKD